MIQPRLKLMTEPILILLSCESVISVVLSHRGWILPVMKKNRVRTGETKVPLMRQVSLERNL